MDTNPFMQRQPVVGLDAHLYVLVGPACAGKSTFIESNGLQREVVSTDALRIELTGDLRRQDKNDEVFEEFRRRISAKLAAGQRVFADATHLRNGDRVFTADVGRMCGVPVTYLVFNRSMNAKLHSAGWRADVRVKGKSLIEAHEETFVANEKTILSGDGNKKVRVIDTRVSMPPVIKTFPRDPSEAQLHLMQRGFSGLCVIGDVHGNMDGMLKALNYAQREGLFPVFLGDIVDYGAQSLECAMLVADLVFTGEAICIEGNHEKKIAKIIRKERTPEGFKGSISHGNDATINRLKAMDAQSRIEWEERFLSFVDQCPSWQEIGNHIFAHGAITKSMVGNTLFRAHRNSIEESYAQYGQTTGEFVNGYPERIYDWIDTEIPTGIVAVVGHAVRSWTDPLVVYNKQTGGKAIFLDTGSSKEGENDQAGNVGRLSWMDVRFGKGARLEDHKFLHEGM